MRPPLDPCLLLQAVDPLAAGPDPLYFHGGPYVAGSPRTALSLTGNLVSRTGFRALSLDYRLAPEHPFPAAIEDALNAYRTLLDGGEDPSAIAFAGDSAGGGLAVTACFRPSPASWTKRMRHWTARLSSSGNAYASR
ncbi:alpha/beta hydrolase fold domain-containing protein [Streptomyces sp. NPDC048361]|uniref:alpha/beta hydrolase fold domain-containing protein n=1 Tax=Streptomyces sp. NPDC048361 TaxID=3154720 RepID=UPI00343821A2